MPFISVPLGSIPELPAVSCQEIKASEGIDTIGNKYWLDSNDTGKASFVYCSNMSLEGGSLTAVICLFCNNKHLITGPEGNS